MSHVAWGIQNAIFPHEYFIFKKYLYFAAIHKRYKFIPMHEWWKGIGLMKAELPGSMLVILVIGLCHSVPFRFNIVAKCNWVLLFRENTRSCIPILCVRVDVGSCCKIYYYVSSPLWNCTSEFILLVLLVRASCSFDTTPVLLQNTEKYIEIYLCKRNSIWVCTICTILIQ